MNEQAEQNAEKYGLLALDNNPESPVALALLASIRLSQTRNDEAIPLLKQSLSKWYGNSSVKPPSYEDRLHLVRLLLISFVGGAIGCVAVLPLNGLTTGTMNWQTFSQLAFAFRITPALLLAGIVFALLMGLLGGLPPVPIWPRCVSHRFQPPSRILRTAPRRPRRPHHRCPPRYSPSHAPDRRTGPRPGGQTQAPTRLVHAHRPRTFPRRH